MTQSKTLDMKRVKDLFMHSGFCLFTLMLFSWHIYASPKNPYQDEKVIPMLENPMSVEYLKKNLRKSHPRLVLNAKIEKNLKKKMETDPVTQNMYQAIQLNAADIMQRPLLERVKIGRRLLGTSREMLWRTRQPVSVCLA